jgi:uncharacterized RDD family membrane protein YckC
LNRYHPEIGIGAKLMEWTKEQMREMSAAQAVRIISRQRRTWPSIIAYARLSAALLLAAVSAATMARQTGFYPLSISPLEWWLRCGGETAVAFVLLAIPFPAEHKL